MFTYMPSTSAQKEAWEKASRGGRQLQQSFLKKEFEGAGWETQRLLDGLEQAPDFYFQAIQQIRMSKWSTSRIVCLGDAAYAPTPLTGAGASLAILGAYVLAGELSKLKDGEHPSAAFNGYESAFRPFVEDIQEIPSFLPGIAHPSTAWKIWFFQVIISVISKIVSIPWIMKGVDRKVDDEDFKLPKYPVYDEEGLKETEKDSSGI